MFLNGLLMLLIFQNICVVQYEVMNHTHMYCSQCSVANCDAMMCVRLLPVSVIHILGDCHTDNYTSINKIKQAVRVATQRACAPCKLTISSDLFAKWHLFQHIGLRHQQQVDL